MRFNRHRTLKKKRTLRVVAVRFHDGGKPQETTISIGVIENVQIRHQGIVIIGLCCSQARIPRIKIDRFRIIPPPPPPPLLPHPSVLFYNRDRLLEFTRDTYRVSRQVLLNETALSMGRGGGNDRSRRKWRSRRAAIFKCY